MKLKDFKYAVIIITICAFSWSFAQEKSVFDIARTGSVYELKAMILNNAEIINKANDKGYYPLTLACYHGNKDVAVYLANNVNNVNVNVSYGTPLTASVFKGHFDLVEELLKLGADPNTADTNGTTNLHYAVMLGNVKIVKLLLEYKANTESIDKKKRKPIDYALIAKNEEIIKLLKKERN